MRLPKQIAPVFRGCISARFATAAVLAAAQKPCSAYPCDTDADCPAGCTCDGFGSCE